MAREEIGAQVGHVLLQAYFEGKIEDTTNMHQNGYKQSKNRQAIKTQRARQHSGCGWPERRVGARADGAALVPKPAPGASAVSPHSSPPAHLRWDQADSIQAVPRRSGKPLTESSVETSVCVASPHVPLDCEAFASLLLAHQRPIETGGICVTILPLCTLLRWKRRFSLPQASSPIQASSTISIIVSCWLKSRSSHSARLLAMLNFWIKASA
mmetsp:Transcript_3739/g.9469  ORF Transcript_3739/g.9469 Transcript_3739/m.9469 type:complete len:212 (-) Transcript_3739:628-1263(-)